MTTHRGEVWRGVLARCAAAGALGLLSACVLGGCNIVGPAIVLAHGPEKTDAAHTLDKKQATVIFVDDRASVLPRRALRLAITESAEQDMMRQQLVERVLDGRAIQAVAARDSADAPSDIVSLGRAVQADAVVYVAMDSFGLSPDGVTYQPFATARVKVISVTGDAPRTWPEDRAGHPLRVTLPVRRTDAPTGASGIARAQDELAREVGRQLARLFYRHETNERVERNRPR